MSAHRLGPLLAAVVALWALWPWLRESLAGKGSDRWGLVSLGLAGLFFVTRYLSRGAWSASGGWLGGAALCLVWYAALWSRAPRLVAAGFGFLALGLALVYALPDAERKRSFALPALVVLGLPIGPSVDYVAGYPLRALSGELAALLLRAGGFQASAVGASLQVNGSPVFLDPACSGVHILWTAVLAALALGTLRGARRVRLAALMAGAVALALLANGWRSAALAFLEVSLRTGTPGWLHELVGLFAFALVAAALSKASCWRKEPCAS